MTTPALLLVHPELGVPDRAEQLDDGERAWFTGPEGESLFADRRRGRWEPAQLAQVETPDPPPIESKAPPKGPRRVPGAAGRGNKAAARLVALFDSKSGQVVKDPTGRRYGVVPNLSGRWETLDSDGLRSWFAAGCAARGDLPGDAAIREATFAVLAREARPEQVYLRVGSTDSGRRIVLDLADESRRVVEIDPEGWRVRDRSPVLFRRTGSLRALPEPVDGGSLEELGGLLGIAGDALLLVIAWLLGCLASAGPFPLLAILGPQGAGKTVLQRLLKLLIDPTAAPARPMPQDVRELAIAAENSYVLGFDNVSGFNAVLSDGLCRLASGAGFSTRRLYSDSDELVLEAARPMLLNSIGESALGRSDLADRALVVQLEPRRRFAPDAQLEAAFNAARPRLLGALCAAASEALRNLPTTSTAGLPRMASFARWVIAAEPALPWSAGEFLRAYGENREAVAVAGIEGDALAQAVLEMVALEGGTLETTAGELLSRLETRESLRRSSDLPRNPRALGDRLRRMVPGLRVAGFVATVRREGHDRERRWVIRPATGADE